jgi:hypothetical protein
MKEVLLVGQMEENLQSVVEVLKTTPYKKMDVNYPKNSIDSSIKGFHIGKKRFFINETSYGPSSVERAEEELVMSDRVDTMDPFRLISGFYWATTKDEKGLLYLYGNESYSNLRHQILDFNYGNGVDEVDDIKLVTDRTTNSLQGSLEKISLSIDHRPSKTDIVFSTQQWVVIRAIKSQFLIKQPKVETVPDTSNSQGKTYTMANGIKAANSIQELNKQLTSNAVTSNDLVFSEKLWEHYIKGAPAKTNQIGAVPLIVIGHDYFDSTFSIDVPFTEKELKKFNAINRPLVIRSDFMYNFYIKEYEKIHDGVAENLLPNMYVLSLESRENDAKNNDYEDLITLDGRIGSNDISLLANRRNANVKDIHGEYFDKYAKVWAQISGKEKLLRKPEKINVKRLTELREKFTNIAIPSSETDILSTYESNKYLFPMCVNLEFDVDRTTYLSSLLKKTNLEIPLMRRLISKNGVYSKPFVEVSETIAQESSGLVHKQYETQVKYRRLWDVSEWISALSEDSKREVAATDTGILLEKGNDTSLKSLDSEIKILLSKLFFLGKIKKLIKDKFRTFENMLKGKEAYSETIIYKVEKSLADQNGNAIGNPIQNYYIANIDELQTIRFVDSQVKYGTRYRYDVYAYQLIIGTKYRYDSSMTVGDCAAFLVSQVPMLTLAEVPYVSVANQVLDDPPVFPDVEMIQYRGYENNLLLWFRNNVGDYQQKPIAIEPDDAKKFEELRIAKQIEGEELRFKSDDHATLFQIYRTDKEPKRYSDFAGLLLGNAQTDISLLTPQAANAASWIDEIVSDKKYWYCFRTLDVHGHVSNPTEVFQVEMINDSGLVYLTVKPFQMNQQEAVRIKPFRKYMKITPSYLQELVNEEKSGLQDATTVSNVNQVHLGLRDQTVWGKKFKIRITSKNTGRKMDLNIDFLNSGVRVEES